MLNIGIVLKNTIRLLRLSQWLRKTEVTFASLTFIKLQDSKIRHSLLITQSQKSCPEALPHPVAMFPQCYTYIYVNSQCLGFLPKGHIVRGWVAKQSNSCEWYWDEDFRSHIGVHCTRKQMHTFLDLLCELHHRHAMHAAQLTNALSFPYGSNNRLKRSVMTLIEDIIIHFFIYLCFMSWIVFVMWGNDTILALQMRILIAKWKTEAQTKKSLDVFYLICGCIWNTNTYFILLFVFLFLIRELNIVKCFQLWKHKSWWLQ